MTRRTQHCTSSLTRIHGRGAAYMCDRVMPRVHTQQWQHSPAVGRLELGT